MQRLETTRRLLAHPAVAIAAAGPALLSALLDAAGLFTHARPLHEVARADLAIALAFTAIAAFGTLVTVPVEAIRVARSERPVVVLRALALVLAVLLLALAVWTRPPVPLDPTPPAILLALLGGLAALMALRASA